VEFGSVIQLAQSKSSVYGRGAGAGKKRMPVVIVEVQEEATLRLSGGRDSRRAGRADVPCWLLEAAGAG